MWLILHKFCVSQLRPSEAALLFSSDSKKKGSCIQKKNLCCFLLQLFHLLYRTQLSPGDNYLELNSFDVIEKAAKPLQYPHRVTPKLLMFSKSVKSEQ